jgi:hypothetical protein
VDPRAILDTEARGKIISPLQENEPTPINQRNNKIMKMRVFWDIAPCTLVGVDPSFRGRYCLHHHPDNGGSTHL